MTVAVKDDIDAVPGEKLVDGHGRPGAAFAERVNDFETVGATIY